jgi:hypothetical protein
MELIETKVKLTGRVTILLADKDLGPIFELHVGGLAREYKSFHAEKLSLMNLAREFVYINVKMAIFR